MDRIVLLFTLCVALAPRVANGACEVPEELKGGRPIDMVMGAGRQARGRITVNTVNDEGNIITARHLSISFTFILCDALRIAYVTE